MSLVRINPMGLEFRIFEVAEGCEVRLHGTEKRITIAESIERLSAAWYQWQMNGKHIQYAFPFLKSAEREFLLTGITPEEWEKMFLPMENMDE